MRQIILQKGPEQKLQLELGPVLFKRPINHLENMISSMLIKSASCSKWAGCLEPGKKNLRCGGCLEIRMENNKATMARYNSLVSNLYSHIFIDSLRNKSSSQRSPKDSLEEINTNASGLSSSLEINTKLDLQEFLLTLPLFSVTFRDV